MGIIKQWVLQQWQEKKFRIAVIAVVMLIAALCVEFYVFQYSVLKSIRYLLLLVGLFVIAWIDRKEKRIPNEILVFLMMVRTVLLIAECIVYHEYCLTFILSSVSGFFIGGGMFLLCYLLTRGGIGAGDVKLFGVLGFYLGSGVIFTTTFLTIVYAAFYSCVKLLMKKTSLKQEMPFAPFIFLGTVTSMILGI